MRRTLVALAVTAPIWIAAWLVFPGLLATLFVPNVIQKYFQAKSTKAKVDVLSIENAAREFAINNGGRWPPDLEALVRRDENGHSYLDQVAILRDPWGRAYLYDPRPTGHPTPRIYTLGRDGLPGGEGKDADIDNWSLEE